MISRIALSALVVLALAFVPTAVLADGPKTCSAFPQICAANAGTITSPAPGTTLYKSQPATFKFSYNSLGDFGDVTSSKDGIPEYTLHLRARLIDQPDDCQSEDIIVAAYKLSPGETLANGVRELKVNKLTLPTGTYYFYIQLDCGFVHKIFDIPGCQGPPGCFPCRGFENKGIAVLQGSVTVSEDPSYKCTLGDWECDGPSNFRYCVFADTTGKTQWISEKCADGMRCNIFGDSTKCGY